MHIRLFNVGHSYARGDDSAAVRVLDDVSLDIASGSFSVLMGASGSGKSTLLNLMGAVDRPTSGRLLLNDDDTTLLGETALTMLRRKSIGFVFQFFNLIPTLTVRENVAFPLALLRVGKAEARRRVDEALAQVGVGHRAAHFPSELSGGEMQRTAIARAVVHRPALILADEPTGNLDSTNGLAVLELLAEIHRRDRPTIVMATHSDRAAAFGERTILIADGRIAG